MLKGQYRTTKTLHIFEFISATLHPKVLSFCIGKLLSISEKWLFSFFYFNKFKPVLSISENQNWKFRKTFFKLINFLYFEFDHNKPWSETIEIRTVDVKFERLAFRCIIRMPLRLFCKACKIWLVHTSNIMDLYAPFNDIIVGNIQSNNPEFPRKCPFCFPWEMIVKILQFFCKFGKSNFRTYLLYIVLNCPFLTNIFGFINAQTGELFFGAYGIWHVLKIWTSKIIFREVLTQNAPPGSQ